MAVADRRDIADSDWMWMCFPEGKHIRWAPQGDYSYELQIFGMVIFRTVTMFGNANKLGQSTKVHKMAVENIPDAKGYVTADSDVFVKPKNL